MLQIFSHFKSHFGVVLFVVVVVVAFTALIKLIAEKSHQIKTTAKNWLQNVNLLQSAPLDTTTISCGAIVVDHNCG